MISSGMTAYAANVARCAKMEVISSALKTRGVWANSQRFSRSNEDDQTGPMLFRAIPAGPADEFYCRVKKIIECNYENGMVQRVTTAWRAEQAYFYLTGKPTIPPLH